jgi:hypothetical protein
MPSAKHYYLHFTFHLKTEAAMAKLSMINREIKRASLAAKFAPKRALLEATLLALLYRVCPVTQI